MSPFDFVNSILNGKKNLLSEDINLIKEYNPWLTNISLSYHQDTVMHANLMNRYSFLSPDIQYEYLFNAVQKRNRKFTKWAKKDKNEDVELISEFYKCNKRVAASYLKILTSSQIDEMRKSMYKGGVA